MYQLKSIFIKTPSQETENELDELPNNITSSLNQQIQALPCHSKYLQIVQSTLEGALLQWPKNPETNELVILSSSIEPLSQIIQSALANWNYEGIEDIKLLSWSNRPKDSWNIVPNLQKDLGLSAKLDVDNNSGKFKELVVIPCLEFCFLRQIHGLDGIEFLRNRIFQDHSRFWLIGCNSLTWQYLDHVYNIKSYFEKTRPLPTMTGEEIMEWLTPVINQLEFENNDQDEEKQIAKIKENFDSLSYVSQGLSSVAAQLWLQSLSMANLENINTQNVNTQAEDTETILVEYKKIKSLDLPESELKADDRYLLFSILLHKEINLSDLALSLGEPESIIQFQIEKLLHLGIIQRLNNLFSVHPAHYLKLCRYLKKYNFITDLIE
ncbi:MAG: hypothetical protein F6K22_30830 [Okeania sp. SIO2F4]|uniref:hypothetical protein n=1 Tax=Okeania sp. SIO2F4 TaxID=2607790 RepID=UPI001429F50E|nr:hypothetical protein [Okeania sp. SIO2F4]NES06826.1 hypothetical protein [Okeania sp. SIO2F4]